MNTVPVVLIATRSVKSSDYVGHLDESLARVIIYLWQLQDVSSGLGQGFTHIPLSSTAVSC